MTQVLVQSWAAVAPGLATRDEWETWARDPYALAGDPKPDVKFLPAMQRRRCDALSRMMLSVANRCCEGEARGEVACVFASRHGSFGTIVSMFEELAVDASLSPTRFSHAVHNTQVGLFSIWAKNRLPAQSLASRRETFEHGFLEAVCMLDRLRDRPVLLVVGDEALPEPLAAVSGDPGVPYAVALRLAREGEGSALELRLERSAPEGATRPAWPSALAFVKWWLSSQSELRLEHPPREWIWSR